MPVFIAAVRVQLGDDSWSTQLCENQVRRDPVVHLGEDIHSMTDFKRRRTSDFVAQLEKTGWPVVLTTNRRAQVVVQDAAAYQKLLEAAQSWAVHEALQRDRDSTRLRRAARGHGAE
jgi:PHD/YefM family antitoxin component YafN of YafNO toxin-antitoxin module